MRACFPASSTNLNLYDPAGQELLVATIESPEELILENCINLLKEMAPSCEFPYVQKDSEPWCILLSAANLEPRSLLSP